MKKSELKALILECNQELAEESTGLTADQEQAIKTEFDRLGFEVVRIDYAENTAIAEVLIDKRYVFINELDELKAGLKSWRLDSVEAAGKQLIIALSQN
jgi:hypothetical protein